MMGYKIHLAIFKGNQFLEKVTCAYPVWYLLIHSPSYVFNSLQIMIFPYLITCTRFNILSYIFEHRNRQNSLKVLELFNCYITR